MTITNTTITQDETNIILSRLIKYKLRKIDFGLDVKACELIPYFALPDEMFLKLTRRD